MFNWIVVIVAAVITCNLAESNQKEILYDGYKVFRVKAETMDQLDYLQTLYDTNDFHRNIDFWSEPNLNVTTDLMVSPEFEQNVKLVLEKRNIKTETLINDVGRIVEMQKETDENSLLYSRMQNDTIFFQRYQSVINMHQFMFDLVRMNPEICSTEDIGTSTEGRPLKIIKIGYPQANVLKPIVWIDAGIHAREWIAPATALYIMSKLVKEKHDSEVKKLLTTFDFHILPSANPDGYEYSRIADRFWRKTRSRNMKSLFGIICIGVDPNRNYGYHWGRIGSSSNLCSQTYHGPYAFSEPETRAISNYIIERKNQVKLFLTLHAYSQLILMPWGWTRDLPKDYSDLLRMAEIGSRALKMKYGTEYRYGSSATILYSASGGADDWAHGAAGIKYSYTMELRDQGTYGFLLPARFIQPTGEETFDALMAMLNQIKKEL